MVLFKSVQELIEQATERNLSISELMLKESSESLDRSEADIFQQMRETYLVMQNSIEQGFDENLKSTSGLTGGMAYKVKHASGLGKTISGGFMSDIISSALSVAEYNAAMGKIVAAPTAGSCGIIPACLCTVQKHFEIPEEKMVMGLINASAIGMVISHRASVSGAHGGCQAECGSAAAMAASAIVEILGGTPDECGHAAAQTLKSLLGLVCDPVAGLVEEPCVIRNASSASVAITCAELTLSGIKSIIPVDEVIDAMESVGNMMPACLRETAEGGVAATPTAQKIAAQLHGN